MATKRVRYLIAAGALVATLGAAAVTLSSAADPDSGSDAAAARQPVVITTEGVDGPPGVFELTPRDAGTLERDSGTESSVWSERVVQRKGQRVAITTGVQTLDGKRGQLKIRFRIGWVEARGGRHVGTGTWKVLRGTGQYARMAGSGRSRGEWSESGPWSGRSDGFVSVRR